MTAPDHASAAERRGDPAIAPAAPVFSFRPFSADDIPRMHEWLHRPHVAEWWDGTPTIEEVAAEYADAIRGVGPVRCYIAHLGDAPIGYIQSYRAVETHADGWWLDEHDPGVHGIDQFLADPAMLGRGTGTAMIRAFVDELFRDPAVTRVQLDPDPTNARAIRSYEKAGFRRIREIVTPDGPALLMYLDRGAAHHRRLERMYAAAPITQYYGASIAIGDGTAEVSFDVKDAFFHAAHAVHGSVYFRALDDAAFFAVSSRVTDAFIVTVSFNITFIRPVTRGRMIARGRVTHVGGRMLTGEAVLVDERERLLAQGSGVFTRSSAPLTSAIGYQP